MIIPRYFFREICFTLLGMTAILLVIFIINQFILYLDDAAAGKFTVKTVMEIMVLQVPILLSYLLPLSFFFSLLLVLGRFYADHEMTVLFAFGVSKTEIMGIVLVLAFIFTLFDGWLTVYVLPNVEWLRVKILSNALMQASLEKIQPGRFQYLDKGNNTFYALKIGVDHHTMQNVFWAHQLSPSANTMPSWDIVSAQEASEVFDKDKNPFILFKNGIRYVGIPGELKYQKIQFKEYGMRLNDFEIEKKHRVNNLKTKTLWQYRMQDKKMAAELAWRFSMPISLLVFSVLAVPLSEINPRKGKFGRLIPAALIYIVYADLMFIGRAWIEKGSVSYVWGLWWIHLSLLLLGLFLFFKRSY